MREIHYTKRVSVRNDAEACVSRVIRETWKVCLSKNHTGLVEILSNHGQWESNLRPQEC